MNTGRRERMDDTYTLIGHMLRPDPYAWMGWVLISACTIRNVWRGRNDPRGGSFWASLGIITGFLAASLIGFPSEWIILVLILVAGALLVDAELRSSKPRRDQAFGALTKIVLFGGLAFFLLEIFSTAFHIGDTIALRDTTLMVNDGVFVNRSAVLSMVHSKRPEFLDRHPLRDWGFGAPGPTHDEMDVIGAAIYYGRGGFITGDRLGQRIARWSGKNPRLKFY